ncbi:MAG: alanine--tRNA ligase [Leptonema sp. (in: bacteria)]
MIKKCRELRKAWIDFFKSKNHLHLPSSSLLPKEDPTLLFTSAGMVPFKDYFSGIKVPPHPRIITIQKCLRTTDLESVGKTARHCTFFEMLGNFSFGDYFKEEAIEWAYEFSISILGFDPEKIYVTVYEEDEEAFSIWKNKIKIPENKIIKLGKEHNWWGPAGDSGPCGPCTELYLDRGEEICFSETGCKDPKTCKPGNECDRFLEYWNLVFNQYFQDTNGNLHLLPKKGIDTGAGLERIVALLNHTDSVYETDELFLIKNKIYEVITNKIQIKLDKNFSVETSLRVLTDHIRSVTFAISDGIFPENTGRGYVIRRIIRRAMLFANQLGIHEPFLYLIHPYVVEIFQEFYPELKENQKKTNEIILEEENKFLETLSKGIKKWQEYLQEHKNQNQTLFDGEKAFTLYDTYGFPLEITIELAEKEGFKVDVEKFNLKMEEQKIQSKQNQQWKDYVLPADLNLSTEKTVFTGYEKFTEKSFILGIINKNSKVSSINKNSDDDVIIITDKTCFYPEGGGQIGDIGYIQNQKGKFRVLDTRKKGDLILHIGQMIEGELNVGDFVEMIIEKERRDFITYHHSATHLLNKALRDVLGDHIYQTGSLVADDYLRFDFSYSKKLTEEELKKVEEKVINAVIAKAEVTAKVMPIEEAKKTGAIATFGEKYGDIVRVIEMGEKGKYSIEFCGGCHVKNTGDIKYFHIVKESSPGAGNRRIEAVANQKTIEYFFAKINEIRSAIENLNEKYKKIAKKELEIQIQLPFTKKELLENFYKNPFYSIEINQKIQELEKIIYEKEKEYKKISRRIGSINNRQEEGIVSKALNNSLKIKNFEIFKILEENLEIPTLRNISDKIKETHPNGIILCGSKNQNQGILLFTCTKLAVENGIDCNELMKGSVQLIKGRGGGKKDMAQGGGTEVENIELAIQKAIEKIQSKL